MKIYTKTGDKGETGLFGGARVTKDCVTLQVVGALDELNAVLGIVVTVIPNECEGSLGRSLIKIQRELFKFGAEVASRQIKSQNSDIKNIDRETTKIGKNKSSPKNKLLNSIGERDIFSLEKSIDEMWGELPELKNFILPGGCIASVHLHQARTICRRAERELVAFGKICPLRPELFQYLNRLSDWLFCAARYANFKSGAEEIIV